MEKAALLAKLKCENVSNFSNEKIENDYMIELCNDKSKETRDDKTKENSLLIDLLENEQFLNYKDYYGKNISNCDFSKIKELQ